jgi:hypothetical protein
VPRFAASTDALAPAQPSSGNQAGTSELKLAAGALDTVGDVFARFLVTFGIGSGLRGGEFTYTLTSYGYEFDLDRVQWTGDLQVSGTMRWDVKSGEVNADLRLRHQGKNAGTLAIAWSDVQPNATATLSGRIAGKRVEAQRIAP